MGSSEKIPFIHPRFSTDGVRNNEIHLTVAHPSKRGNIGFQHGKATTNVINEALALIPTLADQ